MCVKALPDHWINGVIPPLFKGKDSKSELKNYRGVSLLSAPGKSFGKILTEFYKKKWAKFEMFSVSLAFCFPADHWEMWQIKLAVHLLHMK